MGAQHISTAAKWLQRLQELAHSGGAVAAPPAPPPAELPPARPSVQQQTAQAPAALRYSEGVAQGAAEQEPLRYSKDAAQSAAKQEPLRYPVAQSAAKQEPLNYNEPVAQSAAVQESPTTHVEAAVTHAPTRIHEQPVAPLQPQSAPQASAPGAGDVTPPPQDLSSIFGSVQPIAVGVAPTFPSLNHTGSAPLMPPAVVRDLQSAAVDARAEVHGGAGAAAVDTINAAEIMAEAERAREEAYGWGANSFDPVNDMEHGAASGGAATAQNAAVGYDTGAGMPGQPSQGSAATQAQSVDGEHLAGDAGVSAVHQAWVAEQLSWADEPQAWAPLPPDEPPAFEQPPSSPAREGALEQGPEAAAVDDAPADWGESPAAVQGDLGSIFEGVDPAADRPEAAGAAAEGGAEQEMERVRALVQRAVQRVTGGEQHVLALVLLSLGQRPGAKFSSCSCVYVLQVRTLPPRCGVSVQR